MAINQNPFLATNRFGDEKIVMDEILWADVTVAPAATGNTGALPRYEKMPDGTVYLIDSDGRAEKVGSAVFAEAKRWYADPNGLDTNSGANEAPKLTAQAAVTATTQAGTTVLNEGTYAAVTMSVQNTGLVGASGAYGSLSQIAAVTVATASGTSNKISDLTITGNLARTGNAPLYVNNTTVSGNVTLAGTAYAEIRDSSIQDGSITQSGASTLLIEDSKIGSSTFSTAGSVIAMRNVTIDAGDCVTIGAGVVYSLQDVNGCVNIDPAAINAEDAALAAGLSAALAEGAVTTHFHHIRMHNADVELNPTQIVTRDPVTGELEVSDISDIIPDGCCVPSGGTEGQVLTIDENGDAVWETPTGGGTGSTEVADGVTILGTGTAGDPFRVAPDVACGVVYFDGLTPATSTIFDDENPPVADDPALHDLTCATYVSAVDGSFWTWNGTSYLTKVFTDPLHQRDVFSATAGQTTFTLTKTPIGGTEKVHFTRNGVDVSHAIVVTGNVVTYVPALNGGCTTDAADRIIAHYEAV